MKAKRPRTKNYTMTIKVLDEIFSLYIRLRDANNEGFVQCITCRKYRHWSEVDNGHYIKRQYQSTRFNEINCNSQCKYCNNWLQGADVAYRDGIIRKYGLEELTLLEAKPKHKKKPRNYEMLALRDIYVSKIIKLLEEKPLMTEALQKRLDRFIKYK